jgi:tetratricopeptide (TPR) repeat protein
MKRSALLVGLALTAGVARADTVDPQTQAKADALFEKAQAHYQAGEYQAAIELFKSANDLVHDPIYLFNLAQSYRKVLDCVAATDYYRRYLDAAPTAPNRDKVDGWIRELAPCVDERTAEHDAAVREQERAKAAADAAARAARPKVYVDQGRTARLAGIVAGGVGVVGLALGIGFAADGSHLADELAKDCASGCSWNAHEATDSAGRRANAISAVGFVGGGIAAIAGVGLYYYGRTKAAIEVTPVGVSAKVAF